MDYKEMLSKARTELPKVEQSSERFVIPKVQGHIEATKTMGIDDVYCFELDKWFTQRYWEAKMKDAYKGVTLRDLAIAAKV
jgi:peroxiredoxin